MFCKKKKSLPETAEEAVRGLAERGQDIWDDVVDYVGPRAHDAKERLIPLAIDAKGRIVPLINDTREKVQPAFEAALDKAQDAYDVQVRPRLHNLVDDAVSNPTIGEGVKRSHAAWDALTGHVAVQVVPELPVAQAKPASKHPVLKSLGLAAVIGAIGFALKQFLTPKDDGWIAQQPSRAYQPREESVAEKAEDLKSAMAEKVEDLKAAAQEKAEDLKAAVDEKVEEVSEKVEELKEEAAAELAEAKAALNSDDPFRYGEGSFVGDEPPAGYAIKGNERSMKYHTPDAAGYDRTLTDVWFSSPEAAEQAGFTRAQR